MEGLIYNLIFFSYPFIVTSLQDSLQSFLIHLSKKSATDSSDGSIGCPIFSYVRCASFPASPYIKSDMYKNYNSISSL